MSENTESSPLALRVCCGAVGFLSGGVILVLELLAAGWLAPLFGSSLEVWASVLGVTLVSMVGGYFLGSWISKKLSYHWVAWFTSAAGLAILLCQVGLREWFATSFWSVSSLALLGYTTLLLGLPILILSTLSPWLVQIFSSTGFEAGPASGILYAISTLGGVVGAMATGFFWIPYWGLAQTTLFVAWVMVMTTGIWLFSEEKFRPSTLAAALVLFLAVLILQLNRSGEKFPQKISSQPAIHLLYRHDSWYGRHEVYQYDKKKFLLVNGILQSQEPMAGPERYPKGSLLQGGEPLELLPYFRPEGKDALVIGLGGGFMSSYFEKHGWKVQSIEVDPAVLSIARHIFGFEGECLIMDGRRYLQGTEKKFDFIILDVFRGEEIPSHMVTVEFYRLLRQRLKAGGIAGFNLIGKARGPATKAILKSIRQSFPHLRLYPRYSHEDVDLMTLLASPSPFPMKKVEKRLSPAILQQFSPQKIDSSSLEEAPLLTDNRNPLLLIRRPIARQWRQRSKKFYAFLRGKEKDPPRRELKSPFK